MPKVTHGGKRHNAGRPKLKKSQKKEPTKVVRVPLSKLSDVLKLIKGEKHKKNIICNHNDITYVQDLLCICNICGSHLNVQDW